MPLALQYAVISTDSSGPSVQVTSKISGPEVTLRPFGACEGAFPRIVIGPASVDFAEFPHAFFATIAA